jgi:hypothetical protein
LETPSSKIRSVIPFKTRRNKQINKDLNRLSIVEGFIPIPVHVHMSSAEYSDGAKC